MAREKKKRQRCMLAPDSYVMHASLLSFPTVRSSHPSQNVIIAAIASAQKVQNMCDESMSVNPPLWADSFLATRPRTRVQLALRHPLHEADVIVLGKVSVFLQIGAFVLWHTGEKILDQLIRDQGVPKIDFRYVGLDCVSRRRLAQQ